MRTEQFATSSLVSLFHRRQIATMEDMKAALGTAVDMTVFRKLRELTYCTSYSHRGKFYTLEELARFDDRDLWTCRGVHFSAFGSLLDTAEQFVTRSERGLLASELMDKLQVQVKEPLLKLVQRGRLAREELSGLYLYGSPDPVQRKHQLLQRRMPAPAPMKPRRRSSCSSAPSTSASGGSMPASSPCASDMAGIVASPN